MQKKSTNILSLKNPITKTHRSSKVNNKFKKSSTTQYNYIDKNNNINQNPINSINNNIYLNLFNKFNSNISSLRKNQLDPKQIINRGMNNSQISKERKNLNIFDIPSSSSIKRKKNFCYNHPSLINSMNFIDNHGDINIRLNLKNQFINNSNSNYNNFTEINYGLDMDEKMKEKDLKIMQLQNDLLKSQEIINNFQIKNNLEINKYNKLNKSTNEKNICLLTKSNESVDKIFKTAFNVDSSNNSNLLTKKKANNRKSYKNYFLKRCGNKNIIDYVTNSKLKEKNENKNSTRNNSITNRNIYSGYYNKKQSDYLRLFLPNSNNNKPRFNSYSNDKKNIKNKMKMNIENMNKTEKNKNFVHKTNNENKNKEEFFTFSKKCQELKGKTIKLLNNYINLIDLLYKSKIK